MFEILLTFFVSFLPFQFALHPVEGVDLASIRVLAAGIFLWWSAKSLTEKRLVLPRPLILFYFTAFLLFATASFLWAENASWTLRKTAFLLSFSPLFLVFSAVFRDPRLREKIVRASVSGAMLAALFSLMQFSAQFIVGVESVFAFWVKDILPFFLGPAFGETVASYPSLLVNISGLTVMRASGFFPDPHMAAFFFGMSFPLALALAVDAVPRRRTYWLIGAAIILLADLLTFSRGGYIGLLFGMSVFALPLFLRYAAGKKWRVEIGAAALVILILILMSPVGTRLFSSFSQSDGSNAERVRLWQEAGGLIALHPAIGVGLGNYPLSVKPSADYREPIYAHNLFLDIALELGLIGAFFFIAFLFLGISSAWSQWLRERTLLPLAFCSSLIVFSAHSFFETPIFSVHILPLFLLLMAGSITWPLKSGAADLRS